MKRACPYDANLLKMSKVHLMDYDVDVTAMQKIHETTLQKLKYGANHPATILLESSKIEPQTCYKDKSKKQMELTHFFKQSNDSPVFNFTAKHIPKAMVLDESDPCYYCDKKEITNSCLICQEQFCTSCSFQRYNAAEEVYVCLSCS